MARTRGRTRGLMLASVLVALGACAMPYYHPSTAVPYQVVHVQVSGPKGPVAGAVVRVQNGLKSVYERCTTNTDGYCGVMVPASVDKSGLGVDAPEGYVSVPDYPVRITPGIILTVTLSLAHVDPSTYSLQQLAAIRGAMWTVPGPWPYGPRPGQPDNITALEFLYSYGSDPAHLTPTQRAMLDAYKTRGYTHVAFGPPNAQSYHGQYPDTDFTTSPEAFDRWLDWLQVFWDAGLAPVVFLHPDGATFEQTRALYDPLISGNPRAKRLLRIVVPSGWEPAKYEWSSRTWGQYFDWAHALLPDALILAHTQADVDAMAGTDALYDDNGKGNDSAWRYIAPKIHGWLVQTAAFEAPSDVTPAGTTRYQEWIKLWDRNVPSSYYGRFHHGYANWPTGSLWGPTVPIRVYAGEFCSYWVYWQNRPYSECVAWGNAAMAAGADGYLDGGSVPVPVK